MFILRAKNRVGFEQYEPESITASGPEPDLACAPAEMWELVESLEAAHAAAPAFGLKLAPVKESLVNVEEVVIPELVVATMTGSERTTVVKDPV